MKLDQRTFTKKKLISIGIVSELLGLSTRQIRYYEEKGLVIPERSAKGTRKYSIEDLELLNVISEYVIEGMQTADIKEMLKKRGYECQVQLYK